MPVDQPGVVDATWCTEIGTWQRSRTWWLSPACWKCWWLRCFLPEYLRRLRRNRNQQSTWVSWIWTSWGKPWKTSKSIDSSSWRIISFPTKKKYTSHFRINFYLFPDQLALKWAISHLWTSSADCSGHAWRIRWSYLGAKPPLLLINETVASRQAPKKGNVGNSQCHVHHPPVIRILIVRCYEPFPVMSGKNDIVLPTLVW